MKPHHLTPKSLRLSLRLGAASAAWAVATSVALAQTSPAESAAAPSTTITSQVNPLTGQNRSSEELARELARVKLEAELSETRAKLAKSQGDLALATIRQTLDEKRLNEEMRNPQPSTAASSARPTPQTITLPSAPRPTTNTPPEAALSMGQQTFTSPRGDVGMGSIPTAPLMHSTPPSGQIQIGEERIDVNTMSGAAVTRIQSVDRQPSSPAVGSLANPRTNASLPTPFGSPPNNQFVPQVPALELR